MLRAMDEEKPRAARLGFIDVQRGAAVFAMIVVNALEPYVAIPAWAKHAVGDRFTFVDLVAPMFVFVMGLSFDFSFDRRRAKDGIAGAVRHMVFRYGLLFFFGLCGNAFFFVLGLPQEWVILHTLGAVGLIALPFVAIERGVPRVIASVAMMIASQIAMTLWLRHIMEHNAIVEKATYCVGVAGIMVFSSAISEKVWRQAPLGFLVVLGVVVTTAGLLLRGAIPFDREHASLTYLMLGIGLSATLAAICVVVDRDLPWRNSPLDVLGKNALVVFMLSAVLTKVLHAVVADDASLGHALVGTLLVLLSCIGVGYWMAYERILVKL